MPLPKVPLFKILALYAMVVFQNAAVAGALGITTGYFDMIVETSDGNSRLANLGVYRFLYQIPVSDHVTAVPGYSFYFTSFDLGDSGYGVDLEINYFPFTYNQPMVMASNRISWFLAEEWRPSVGLAFHQRQFQVVRSAYGGIGLTINCDYQLSEMLAALIKIEYSVLRGPLKSTLSERQISFGITRSL